MGYVTEIAYLKTLVLLYVGTCLYSIEKYHTFKTKSMSFYILIYKQSISGDPPEHPLKVAWVVYQKILKDKSYFKREKFFLKMRNIIKKK